MSKTTVPMMTSRGKNAASRIFPRARAAAAHGSLLGRHGTASTMLAIGAASRRCVFGLHLTRKSHGVPFEPMLSAPMLRVFSPGLNGVRHPTCGGGVRPPGPVVDVRRRRRDRHSPMRLSPMRRDRACRRAPSARRHRVEGRRAAGCALVVGALPGPHRYDARVGEDLCFALAGQERKELVTLDGLVAKELPRWLGARRASRAGWSSRGVARSRQGVGSRRRSRVPCPVNLPGGRQLEADLAVDRQAPLVRRGAPPGVACPHGERSARRWLRLRRDPLSAAVRPAVRPLLPLPELPAPDGERVRLNILIETDRIELLAGDPQPVDVPRSSGTQRIFRCPTCQIAVYSRYTRATTRFVRAGTLDDPSAVEPDVHIYTRSKLPWVTLPEGVPAFSTYYDTEKLWPAESLERLAALGRRK